MRRPTALLAPLLLLAASVAAACGGGGEPETQPAEDTPTFATGDFGEIPVYPLADPIGTRTETGDTVAQSFRVRNATREQIFSWYRQNLAGWQLEVEPRPIGEAKGSAWRARWLRGDDRLFVTVSGAPTINGGARTDERPVLQMSLSLQPTDHPLPKG